MSSPALLLFTGGTCSHRIALLSPSVDNCLNRGPEQETHPHLFCLSTELKTKHFCNLYVTCSHVPFSSSYHKNNLPLKNLFKYAVKT